jgi:hypothetical protein
MPDRATVNQTVQIGVETVYGTKVPCNIRLQGISIDPSVQTNVDVFRAMGVKYPAVAVQGREWVQAAISGSPTFDELIYLLSSCVAASTPTLQGTAGAWKWDFNPSSTNPDTYKSFSVEHGSSSRADAFTGGVVTSLGFTITRERVDLTGQMIGQLLDNSNPAMTATPTGLPLVPIAARYFDVFLDNTSVGLGTTKLTRPLSVGFALDNRFGPVWAIDSSKTSFTALVETVPRAQVRLMVEADAVGMALLDTLRTGAEKFMRVKTAVTGANTTPNITGSAPALAYNFQFDAAMRVSAVSQFRDNGGIYAIEYTLDVVDDATWGKAFSFSLTNGTATL